MAQEAKTKFDSSMQRLLSMKEKLEALLNMTQMAYQKHHQACVQSKTDIEKIMSNFQNLIETQKKQLITKIDSNNTKYEPVIKQQQEDIDEQLKTVLIRILLTKQMCDTSNLHQIIKMKGDLIIYNELIEEQYEQLMEGCMFDIMRFVPDDTLSQIKELLEKLDNISVESFLTDRSHIQPLLKVSDVCDDDDYIALDGTYAYGYRFYLTVPLKFQAVRVKSKLVDNDLSIYILNSNDIVIQTETIHVNNRNSEVFKWFAIPITCEIENNYSILVWAKSNGQETPLIICNFEDHNLRRINQNVSVRNEHALIDTSQSVEIGMKLNVLYDALSNNDPDLAETVPCIKMILDI
ncbi:unnamed protein product [Rotaria sp. Silwood1]|nr:unnamed protein product [Rotaria sp. Silwood1]CAF1622534.1 unnamed protein product [Rotaria sp. Silwood1]CAF3746282.1 unnamed protein product [Rotaria sp. Silwood1]CAF4632236.1 unnamed protein product [Rotaria sp. Silwood1]